MERRRPLLAVGLVATALAGSLVGAPAAVAAEPVLTDGVLRYATAEQPYGARVVAEDADLPEDELGYELVEGPDWVTVSTDGVLSGTPGLDDVGTASVRVRVTDGAGDGDTATFTLEVYPDYPFSAGGPYEVVEGEDLVLTGATPYPDWTVQWDVDGDIQFGDAEPVLQPTVTAAELADLGLDGPYTGLVTALYQDPEAPPEEDEEADADTPLTIVNAAPTASVEGPDEATAGEEVTLVLRAEDPSPLDQAEGFGYVVDWGDGSTTERDGDGDRGRSVSHRYDDAGRYEVTATATDVDGGESEPVPLTISVAAASSPSPDPGPSPTPEPSSPRPPATAEPSAPGPTATPGPSAPGPTATPDQPPAPSSSPLPAAVDQRQGPSDGLADTGVPAGVAAALAGAGVLLLGGGALVAAAGGRRRR